jgi:hypothetical protein
MSKSTAINREEFIRAINMLDACEEALDLAAKAEASQERGKVMRETTHQMRAEAIKRFVAKYSELIA